MVAVDRTATASAAAAPMISPARLPCLTPEPPGSDRLSRRPAASPAASGTDSQIEAQHYRGVVEAGRPGASEAQRESQRPQRIGHDAECSARRHAGSHGGPVRR